MKNYKTLILIFLLGCSNSVDDLEIGDPFDQSTAIADQWTLRNVHHIDELDLSKPFTDLTTLFSGNTQIEFDGSSFTYTHGGGPNFLENNGTWAFDDSEYPEFVTLNQSTSLKLGAPIRASNDTLILLLQRKCDERVISSYKYLFTRN